ncbi:Uncharacterised protein [Mycobacteroides abscessus subsp. bolletii]|uniref:hypothetical protein n=1 Tax=Mycobacteroides abscessus TaxID=36809 RepID=UPI0009A6F588|nr:hypothetical protein [Mycobacteroides abscessus]MDQ8120537.1 hypothetical protein [Mycobacteroides abscessus subsp. massiliense]SKY24345.1 Uncharacterised protein [Mycobacteroides abscessus subsp. bolletii]
MKEQVTQSSGSVIRLDDHRTPPTSNHRCIKCGSEWFRLDGTLAGPGAPAHGAVVLAAADRIRITGYCGTPRCLECGHLVAV